MCIIVDACVVGLVFGDPASLDGESIFNWLMSPQGRLASGGQLKAELYRHARARDWYVRAFRNGKIRETNDQELTEAARQVRVAGHARSNDLHVLAVALTSNARLLFTSDAVLMRDFKNHRIISGPRGKVYATIRNANLLRRVTPC